ncbi:hypothetical protein Pan181_14500 [Aeoliella mucimassa]|uniref:DUF420 domain-containing protein n=2 Tax=Aeoliella mucimassa TaxID=2527972 RepID=A0A518AKL1_9BACT|nr:hypothetical protein Pan181_14500 [Aeoliella mucimassa]
MEFPGVDGFLGTRASLMLDVVFLAMFLVIPLMAGSIALARFRRQWQSHKLIQLTLGIVLLLAVVAFEVDMQFLTKWEARAEPSPYFSEATQWSCPAGVALIVHLMFAVPTALVWVYVIVSALRQFPKPPVPGAHSFQHKLWGRVAAIGMTMTAITGWVFYYMAFVAS